MMTGVPGLNCEHLGLGNTRDKWSRFSSGNDSFPLFTRYEHCCYSKSREQMFRKGIFKSYVRVNRWSNREILTCFLNRLTL